MSISSYRRNVQRRVTGPCSPTCFPAALEQVSPYDSLPPQAYRDYVEFGKWYDTLSMEGRKENLGEFEDLIGYFARKLGGVALDEIVYKRATTALGLKRIINKLIEEEYRVVVEVSIGREAHAVGLLPLPEPGYFTLVSNYLPKTLQGFVTLDHIAPRLSIPSDPHVAGHPINDSNITALPPAA